MKKLLIGLLSLLSISAFSYDVFECSKGYIVTIISEEYADVTKINPSVASDSSTNLIEEKAIAKSVQIYHDYSDLISFAATGYLDENFSDFLFTLWGSDKDGYSLSIGENIFSPGSRSVLDSGCKRVKLNH